MVDPRRMFPLGIWLAFFLLSVLLYWGLWDTQFYKDDYDWLTIGRNIARSPLFLFTPDPVNQEAVVRGLQRILFALVYTVWGLNPAGYHLMSLVLHAVATTLGFFLLRELLLRAAPEHSNTQRFALAFLGAFFFATNYNHSSAVLWASSMSTLLVTSVLTALFLFVLRHDARLHEPRIFATVVVGFLLALAAKNTAVSFPLVLGFYFWILSRERRHPGARAWLVGTLLVLGMAQALFTKAYLGHVDLGDVIGSENGTYAVSSNIPQNLLGAFLGCFLPAGLYDILLAPIPFEYVALTGLTLVGILHGLARERRELLLGTAWLFVAAFPVSLFDYKQYDPTQVMVNRYYYLPLVGGMILWTFTLLWILGLSKPRRFFAGLAVAALLHSALHVPLVRARVQNAIGYGRARAKLIQLTLQETRERLPEGSVIYAVDWSLLPPYIPRISQLYFEEHGFRLLGPDEWELLRANPPRDGVPRFVARYHRVTAELELYPWTREPEPLVP